MSHFFIDGITFTPDQLVKLGYSFDTKVDLTDSAWAAVVRGRKVVNDVIERNETVYGINTGFGNFANVIIPNRKLQELQENLIRSHAAGVGEPLSPQQTRMLLILRINVLAKGHSGVTPETLKTLLKALNNNCLPRIPRKGTVGASGDLAPLSHLALGMLGEGKMWDRATNQYHPAGQVLQKYNIEPIKLKAKEGLALINGTQLITSIGAEAVVRARNIARQADIVACLTVEALKGSTTPFHPAIHAVRPHRGQAEVAARCRALLNFGKEKTGVQSSHNGCGKIHGIVHDTVDFAYGVLSVECNSATDNPMIFADIPTSHMEPKRLLPLKIFDKTTDEHKVNNRNNGGGEERGDAGDAGDVVMQPGARRSRSGTFYEAPSRQKGVILSGGNFHGEYPAKSLDYLTIGIHEIASCSERRIERLVNPTLSALPAFLVDKGGLNSGFMIAHCTAAALVSENKTLCHPASVDSISTSAAQEDHVSMGGFAARKALTVVQHVEYCIAIELLCAVQAMDFLRPLRTTPALERVIALVRSRVKHWSRDRFMAPAIESVVEILKENLVWEAVEDEFTPKSRL